MSYKLLIFNSPQVKEMTDELNCERLFHFIDNYVINVQSMVFKYIDQVDREHEPYYIVKINHEHKLYLSWIKGGHLFITIKNNTLKPKREFEPSGVNVKQISQIKERINYLIIHYVFDDKLNSSNCGSIDIKNEILSFVDFDSLDSSALYDDIINRLFH